MAMTRATPASHGTWLLSRSMASTWKIGCIDLLTNAHGDFVSHHVGEGPLHGFLHQPVNTASDSELAGSRGTAHFQTVDADLTKDRFQGVAGDNGQSGIPGRRLLTWLDDYARYFQFDEGMVSLFPILGQVDDQPRRLRLV
jgi:hypothetical protein